MYTYIVQQLVRFSSKAFAAVYTFVQPAMFEFPLLIFPKQLYAKHSFTKTQLYAKHGGLSVSQSGKLNVPCLLTQFCKSASAQDSGLYQIFKVFGNVFLHCGWIACMYIC